MLVDNSLTDAVLDDSDLNKQVRCEFTNEEALKIARSQGIVVSARLIGRGSSAVVLRCELKGARRVVAVKMHFGGLADDEPEMAIDVVPHPNIVDFKTRTRFGHVVCDVYEFVEGPTVRELLLKSELDEYQVLAISLQLAKALHFCHHEATFVHRDVKPENIVVSKLNSGELVAKLVDLTLMTRIPTLDSPRHSKLGTNGYKAPEIESHGQFGPASDIYAWGVTSREMLCSALGCSIADLGTATRVRNKEFRSLVLASLNVNPANRPSAKDIIERLQRHERRNAIRKTWLVGVAVTFCILLIGLFVGTNLHPDPISETTSMRIGHKSLTVFRAEWSKIKCDKLPRIYNALLRNEASNDIVGNFTIVEDSKYFDLSDWVKVDSVAELESSPLQPAYFTRVLSLVRTPESAHQEWINVRLDTSGFGVVPILEEKDQIAIVKGDERSWWGVKQPISSMILRKHIGHGRVGQKISVTAQAVFINGFVDIPARGAQYEWAGARVEGGTRRLDLSVGFPQRLVLSVETFLKPDGSEQASARIKLNRQLTRCAQLEIQDATRESVYLMRWQWPKAFLK